MQQWQPGHKLKNRPYEIIEELGEGGFGITYKAKDLTLDIPVVIKTPNSKLQRDANYSKYVENFKKEAKQLARLGLNPHPHIVRVSSLFEEENIPCIVMDFIPGESLYDLVQMQGALSEAEALGYIRQIGSALVVCHQAGIIHRDVHPNNILIHEDNGKAVLIDFGISGTTQTSRNTHSGNRAFAPWEQMAYWEGENSKTPQVDIYTLAAGFYYLVTGEVPTECLARKYNNRELIEPKQLKPHLSEGINQAIVKGMEVLPENRSSSIKEWLELLDTPPAAIRKQAIPPTDIPEYNQQKTVPPAVKSSVSRKNLPTLKAERSNLSSIAITRRGWLKYLGLIVGAMGVTLIGKNIWDNSQQPIDESEPIKNSPSASNESANQPESVENSPELSEYKFDVITVNDRGEEIKREEGKAKYFTEDLGNGITLEMVEIPGGTFWMGTEEQEIERLVKKYVGSESPLVKKYVGSESPQHKVTVPSFYMGKFEVTQAQWKQVVALPTVGRDLESDPFKFKGANLPVESVFWDDAVEFCRRLSNATGKKYRLPSEAEWEYACRAGTTTPFHFGKTITTELANYDGNYIYSNELKGEYRKTTTPVGSFPPNAFGLYDMHGNAWEYCLDTYHYDYQDAPNDGSAWISNDSHQLNVYRGGYWKSKPYECRSAYRGMNPFVLMGPLPIGFRCVMERTF